MDKVEEKIQKINEGIEKLKNKDFNILFVVPDTKGNGRASVSYIYRQAMVLHNAGYKVKILTEKKDYISPVTWMGDDISALEHISIENGDLKVSAVDILVIPEIFGAMLEQITQLPVDKFLLVQMYEHLLAPFAPGKSWVDFNVYQTITTSNTVAEMIMGLEPSAQITNFISPYIPEFFRPSEKLSKPIIAIHCRDQKKAARLIKTFYLKYPLFKFIAFKDMHNMTEQNFADQLKECAVSVWIDEDSTFGTFPVESIKCNVPVIGKIPNIIPEWLNDDNGLWVYDENQIVDIIFSYMKNWLEDSVPENYKNVYKTMEGKYEFEAFQKSVLDFYNKNLEFKIQNWVKIIEQIKNDNTNEE